MIRKTITFVFLILLFFSISIPICSSIGDTLAADTDVHVVYWSMNGKDSNKGTTANAPVKTLSQAFTLLAKYKNGGTVVLIGGVNTRANGKLTDLPDAGGTVTITSVYGGTDYRQNTTDPARLFLHYGYSFNNDVVFDSIDFLQASVSATDRALYLKHNDLTVNPTCAFYSYSGSTSSDKCPAKGDAVTSDGTLIIVTGHKTTAIGSEAVKFDQSINLQGGCYKRIYVGNKAYSAASDEAPSQTRLDYGNVCITIGGGTVISDFIDATQDIAYDINTYLELPNTDIPVLLNEGIAPSARVTIRNAGTFEITDSALKMHGEYPAVLIRALTDVEWTDSIEASEFGIIFTVHNGTDSLFITENTKLGKSYAYTSDANGYRNYEYSQGSANAAFTGVLVYDTEDLSTYANAVIIAYPYAVDGKTGYTVTGRPCVFNLQDVCELIISNEDTTEENKKTASDILEIIASTAAQ